MRNPESASARNWPVFLAGAQRRRQVLLLWLGQRAYAEGFSMLALAHVLGISSSHLYAMYAGESELGSIDEETVVSIAQYLGQPPILIRCALDVRLEDFFTERELARKVQLIRHQLPLVAGAMDDTHAPVLIFAALLSGLPLLSRRTLTTTLISGSPREYHS